MQQHVKKAGDLRRSGLAQQMLRDGQMTGAGDGQELRHALDEAQQDRVQQCQCTHAPLICFDMFLEI